MHSSRFESILSCVAIAVALALPASLAADEHGDMQEASAQDAPNPYAKADDSWISISGTVESVSADQFLLDFGNGVIGVEMDDGDRDADAYKLLKGDKVRVTGLIDDDFLELRTIEASSVTVEKLGTTFYASAADEETPVVLREVVVTTTPIQVSETVLIGTVTSVSEEEFRIDTGLREMTVEVEEMPYNPLDDEGYQRIEVGDRVSVTGDIDMDLFEGRELVADSVVTLDG